ncbi:uncharacterized protein BP5553_08463 [Venustampulla echinocandica]|uniref:Uncharacterized protein n=1 Tax=Venustampulla echinocandica TaxID=2656787 RepID=A0A370TEA4_9HELO|nr:uncharacterized protein BP5553_08463 [Venustampulla echinocandica]RDL33024.1 hypothetical protein BP5553_08463 [Venustampulla echinocandica]
MAAKVLLLGAALISAVSASAAAAAAPKVTDPPAYIKAFVPKARGQIIINPVESELGNADSYRLTNFGPDNPVVTFAGGVYHYIEAHKAYLSEETVTTTVNNAKVTTKVPVAAAVATGTGTATPGLGAGDLAITFSESVADALRKTADNAIAACSLTKRDLSKRLDSVQCIIDAAVKASGESGPFDAVMTEAFWNQLGSLAATNAPEYLTSALAVLATQAVRNKALVILGAIIVGTKLAGPIAMLKIPEAGVGAPTSDHAKPKCDASAGANKDSPLCSDSNCKGNSDSPKCTAGDNKGCACLLLGTDFPLQIFKQSWWDNQQQVVASFAANPNLLGTAPPSCHVNSFGNAFDGKPAASPASWCVCNIEGIDRIYPTVASASAPCALTTLPAATISPTLTAKKGGSVTSCRTSTVTGTGAGTGSYCTCNDNSMYGVDTWTVGTQTVTGCSATRTTSSKTTNPAMATATCNPPQRYSMEQDRILLIAEYYCPSTHNGDAYKDRHDTTSGVNDGGVIAVLASLDKGCVNHVPIDQADCRAALQSIYDKCHVGQSLGYGGSASIKCQRFNVTIVKYGSWLPSGPTLP